MKQIPSPLSQATAILAKYQLHPSYTFTNTPEARCKAVNWQGESSWVSLDLHQAHVRKVSRLLSLLQRSFHSLFHVLTTATPITADPRRQPAYSIQECTFAAYTHALNSTKHYQNSRKESNCHTADFSLKQFYRCIAPLSMEQRVSSPQMAMPLPGLKKERLHYSKNHPNNKKIT